MFVGWEAVGAGIAASIRSHRGGVLMFSFSRGEGGWWLSQPRRRQTLPAQRDRSVVVVVVVDEGERWW